MDYKQYKEYAEDFLQRYYGVNTNRNFKCLNPMHTDSNPSMGYNKQKCNAHCFGCDACYDIYDLVGIYFGIENKDEQYKKVEELYGHGNYTPKPKKKVEPKPEIDTQSIKEYLEKCIADVYKTDYFAKRGLTSETVFRCNLGYDEEKQSIVIPYSKSLEYYQTRNVNQKSFYKPPKDKAGEEPLYNMQALRLKTRKPVFVVESPLCAISIIQCGGQAVALGGAGIEKLITVVKAKKPLGTLVLALDNDETGRNTTAKLRTRLLELDVKTLVYNIADDCKDPNELLMKKATKLQENIEKAEKEAKKLTATKFDSKPLEEMLLIDYPPPIWIIDDFLTTGLSIICSPSKFGKSWMMLQAAEAIVFGEDFLGFKTHKCDVEYMALEDTEPRVVGRVKKHLNGRTLPHGIHISTKAPTLDKDKLLDVLAEKLEENPKIKLFIIDTLQKIRRVSVKADANQYANDYIELGLLKEFADDNQIAIWVVHHTRKSKDSTDPYSNILGSTAIQGVTDTMMVLDKDTQGQVILSYKGRDVGTEQKVIEFDDDKKCGTNKWFLVGTPEEQAETRRKREYATNPIVVTIKELLKNNPSGWSGTATEILNAIYDVTKKPAAYTSSQLGKEIQSLVTKLHIDGIDVTSKRSGEKRTHTFTYNKKPSWMNYCPSYQPKFYD